MNEKILQLLTVTGCKFDEFVDNIAKGLGEDFKQADQEGLSEPRKNAIQAFKQKLLLDRLAWEERVCAAFAKLFNEAELDELLAFYERPIAKKAANIGQLFMNITSPWIQEVQMKTPELKTIVDELAMRFMVNNTEGDVAESIADHFHAGKQAQDWTPPSAA